MAVRDFEAFIRERAVLYDPNLDTNPGSPFDTQVIQPLVRRLGIDPFTVDLSTFVATRMQQAFPDIANQEEDAVTDLLNKPVTLLWDPVVRENIRVRQNLSFADPTQMTNEEADALGANFFSTRKRGFFSRGVGRILFSQAQNASISPANFFTSKGGLHFFPIQTQSIRTEEMILNITADGLYYFDINVIAEDAGTQYNIGPNELISVANVPSATRVLNTRRFRSGEKEETAQEFISRVKQELSERSLVTLRGVAAKLVDGFPEINRLNVVGFNDPEMQRDIIKGGGLGELMASGNQGVVVADGEGKALQRRFLSTEVDFIVLAGAQGVSGGLTLTVFDAFGPSVVARDLDVINIISANEVDVAEQVMVMGASSLRWTLRRRELTLSDIPGGILYPNTPNGELVIPSDVIHIGGQYDTYVRGSGFDDDAFTITNVTDDAPLLAGLDATVVQPAATPLFQLNSLVLGVDFVMGDETTQDLDAAVRFGYTLQVQDAPEAGNYRILDWTIGAGNKVLLEVDPTPSGITALNMRWRLFDQINVDLLNPRETRIIGSDLSILQNSDVVGVGAGTDFLALGVSQGDILEIRGGSAAGLYTIIVPPLTPTQLKIDTILRVTESNLTYSVYRANEGGALRPPFVRITSIELLDSSGQPVGTKVPYARPVDVQTRAFQNPARGVKHDVRDTILGLVSAPGPFNISSTDLVFTLDGLTLQTLNLTTTGAAVPVATVITELNAQFLSQFGIPQAVVQVGTDRFGIRPVGAQGFVALVGGAARAALYGNTELRTSGDVRSASIDNDGGWATVTPPIDFGSSLDVFQVLDGSDIGFYGGPLTTGYSNVIWPAALPSTALLVGNLDSNDYIPTKGFAPARGRHTQVGARSLGSARVYFLEPTSFEVDNGTVFSLDLGTQGIVRFLPDPSLEYQKLPALPSNTPIQDGTVANSSNLFSSASQDFIRSGIQPGDRLEITNIPLEGTQVLSDPVQFIAGETLVFSLDGGADRTTIFLRDDASLSAANREVSRVGIVNQINASAGETIVELTSDFRLRFKTAKDLVVRGLGTGFGQGTSNALILGDVANTGGAWTFQTVNDQNNESPVSGSYTVDDVFQTDLQLDQPFAFDATLPFTSPLTGQAFFVYRAGVQRISTTQMAENKAEAGLYYFDVELISQGTGDLWNVDASHQLTVEGYRSDGYFITTDDENLTFSEVEKPRLVLSRTILESGVDDDPANATQLTGENLQVSYERSQLITDVQNFLSSETERVICANPLSRHLIPHFVRFDVNYTGGSREDIVLGDIEEYVTDLAPVDTLDSSDIIKIVTDQGANYVQSPLELIAVIHQIDRTVTIERSQNQLAVENRLSAFIPELIQVTREVN